MASAPDSVGPRRLGPTETFYQLQIDKYNACHYVHIAIINSSAQLSPADVKKAFEVLCEQYEALRMRVVPIEEEELAYRFETMKETAVNLHVTKISKKSDWPQLLSDENQKQIDCLHGPIWNVVMAHVEKNSESSKDPIQHQCVLLVSIHHAIADATCMTDVMYLHFMPLLSAVVNNDNYQGLLPKVPLYKSTEELFASKPFDGSRYKVPWYLKLLFDIVRWKNRTFGNSSEFNNQFFFPEETRLTEMKLSELPPCQPELFDKDLSSSIIQAAKTNGVTVHTVFLAVNSIALCKTADDAGIKLPGLINQSSPVDLRKYLNWERPQPLGAHTSIFVSVSKSQAECSINEFWKMCKDIREAAKKNASKENTTALLGVGQYFVDAARKVDLMDVISEFGLSSISSISNRGVCDLGAPPVLSKGPVTVDMTEQYFTVTGMRRLKSTSLVHYVLTYNSKIAWNFSYNVANVGRRFVDEYLKNIRDIFWKYCGETPV